MDIVNKMPLKVAQKALEITNEEIEFLQKRLDKIVQNPSKTERENSTIAETEENKKLLKEEANVLRKRIVYLEKRKYNNKNYYLIFNLIITACNNRARHKFGLKK
ncbi:MAG: hypothetical protein LBR09_02160 [Endomicrobium sp.]|nr:hypothetical protein [Endomicrobium sp.]